MSTQRTSAIHVQGLEKSYGPLRVLRGVDFDVARGDVFALLGSPGAGKSTLVKILSTLVKADAGSASVHGFDVATQAAYVRASINFPGRVADVDAILSGRENLVLAARARHFRYAEEVADGLLERCALTEVAARRVSTYSDGMRRRLDIALRLVDDPPVVLLDEPATGLDRQACQQVWWAVKGAAERGAAVLLTAAQLNGVEQFADRLAILHEGRIVVNGTPTELRLLLPPAAHPSIAQRPSLEDVFFALVGA